MTDPKNLFWDSCVFIRYLTRQTDGLNHIDAFIEDAQKKTDERRTIYYSTLVFTEIRPQFLNRRFGTVDAFFKQLGSAFEPVDPNPNILIAAGELRDAPPTNPNKGEPTNRVLGTPDAIHLSTCVFVRDVLGVSDIVFHTFDEGRGAGWEGKCIPIIGFDRWYPEPARAPRVAEVCALRRERPNHPNPGLDFHPGA